MRTAFLIFFAVFFLVFTLINFYVFIRGWQAIPREFPHRDLYAIVFWLVALSFFYARLLENLWPSTFTQVLVWIGSFWIGAVCYLVLTVVFLDILRFINYWYPFFPGFIVANYRQAKLVSAFSATGVVAVLLLGGYINALMPRVRTLELTIDKKTGEMRVINIVVASDIHLGTIVGRTRFNHIVDKINSLKPDVVLLPGDIVDEDLAPVIRQNLGETLRSIRSRFGVFAVTGNHEYIGGVEDACRYLTDHDVVMLRDQAVKVNGSFFLVGREDQFIRRFVGKARQPLKDLMSVVDQNYPVILMDHEPFHLEEGAQQGVDLQLSGHTHNGQLWPVNYIICAIFEVAWGYKKIANTHVYVSSGVGTWGPPVRIGHRPEIVNIRLTLR